MTSFRMLMIAGFVVTSTSALALDLPATASKATLDEFKEFADGKTVEVDILDMEKPVTATLVWSWADATISGTAVIDGSQKVEVKVALSFDGEKACSKGEGDPTCHLIYIDREAGKFYEVRDDGAVHAVSTIKP